jgi:hypothetical protein
LASLSRRDQDFDADLWADLAARVLGVAAAFGLAALGLFLLIPTAGAGHLPALPLGAAEPQRPLIGLLCFALSGLVATSVMLFRTPAPSIRKPRPTPREMNLAPAGPAEAPPLAPFPTAGPWRPPEPPEPIAPAVDLESAPSPEPAPEAFTPPATPDAILPVELAATEVLEFVQPEIAPPATEQSAPEPPEIGEPEIEEPEIDQPELRPEPTAAEPAPIADVEPQPPPPEAVYGLSDEDFYARRQKLKATLGEASALAAALNAQAVGDHQHALAAQDVGDAALAAGAADRAADAYDWALRHARSLLEAHPDALAVRTVLAEVLAKIGDLNAAKGRMGAATDAYEEAISHRRDAARLGEAGDHGLGLAAVLEKLAMVRKARGETDKARALYTESLEHLAPLVAEDPRHGDMAYRAKLSLLALDDPA